LSKEGEYLRQYKKNNRYREKCLERQKIWRKNYPADQYQKEYRKKHSGYTSRNRKLQKGRNKKRQKEYATMVIKPKAIVMQPGENGTYLLSKVKKNMIVNRNALSLQPSIDGGYTLYKIKERKIVNRNAFMAIRQ